MTKSLQAIATLKVVFLFIQYLDVYNAAFTSTSAVSLSHKKLSGICASKVSEAEFFGIDPDIIAENANGNSTTTVDLETHSNVDVAVLYDVLSDHNVTSSASKVVDKDGSVSYKDKFSYTVYLYRNHNIISEETHGQIYLRRHTQNNKFIVTNELSPMASGQNVTEIIDRENFDNVYVVSSGSFALISERFEGSHFWERDAGEGGMVDKQNDNTESDTIFDENSEDKSDRKERILHLFGSSEMPVIPEDVARGIVANYKGPEYSGCGIDYYDSKIEEEERQGEDAIEKNQVEQYITFHAQHYERAFTNSSAVPKLTEARKILMHINKRLKQLDACPRVGPSVGAWKSSDCKVFITRTQNPQNVYLGFSLVGDQNSYDAHIQLSWKDGCRYRYAAYLDSVTKNKKAWGNIGLNAFLRATATLVAPSFQNRDKNSVWLVSGAQNIISVWLMASNLEVEVDGSVYDERGLKLKYGSVAPEFIAVLQRHKKIVERLEKKPDLDARKEVYKVKLKNNVNAAFRAAVAPRNEKNKGIVRVVEKAYKRSPEEKDVAIDIYEQGLNVGMRSNWIYLAADASVNAENAKKWLNRIAVTKFGAKEGIYI